MVSTMGSFPLHVVFLTMLLFYGSNAGEQKTRCMEVERQALLKIKQDLHEIKNVGFLSSWGNEEDEKECCEWYGVQCANNSGHVIALDLSPSNNSPGDPFSRLYKDVPYLRVLQGNISPSLCNLKCLTYLDLSLINLTGHGIPSFIGTLTKLRHLNLSYTLVRGEIPTQLANLSNLEVLDLGSNYDLRTKNVEWIFHLSSLRLLDLSYTNMSQATNWMQLVNKLPYLKNLHLSRCHLPNVTSSSLSLVNSSTSLSILDLSWNQLSASIYQWLLSFSRGLVHLDLQGNMLEGSIPEGLLNVSTLEYLDLSDNNIEGFIPESFGNMKSLTHLVLSWNKLEGSIPEGLLNASTLEYLDLSGNNIEGFIPESLGNMTSLMHLDLSRNKLEGSIPEGLLNVSTLEYLDLSDNNIEGFIQESFGNMTSLTHLVLSWNKLEGSIPEGLLNVSTLEYLDLCRNDIEGFTPESLGNMTSLMHLDLSWNKLEGSIPEALGNLTSLTYLDLSFNYLEGELPKSLWNLCMLSGLHVINNSLTKLNLPDNIQSFSRCRRYSLESLAFDWNPIMGSFPNLTLLSSLKYLLFDLDQFSGTVPEAIGQLSQLESLAISGNSSQGVISEAHFSKLSKLSDLTLSGTSLILNISSDWNPPFQLDFIDLGSCKVGPWFPKWLQTQKNYSTLNLSHAGISDSIPNWFWDLSSKVGQIDLSNNQIYGPIPSSSIKFMDYPEINLSSNLLEGPIPLFILKAGAIDLSRNRFSKLNSLCHVNKDSQLTLLDVSYNQLSGDLPDCWSNLKELSILVLANNKLSGKIPVSIGSLIKINTLNLGNNNFTQELPCLRSCKNLEAINLAENKLLGPIPAWIGESLSNLVILSLRSNYFFGSIPSHLCRLAHLQLLDISSNNLSGSLPKCLNNFTAMKRERHSESTSISHKYSYRSEKFGGSSFYVDQVQLVWKGTVRGFNSTLRLVKSIDLSNNELNGEIPTEISELVELVSLNLSKNHLNGQIPSEIGRLNLLDALDLSNNQLSGGIPSSLSEVPRLNVLDLSNNNLSGKIPTGTQLQSFEVSSYTGNPELCGAPLPICPGDEPTVSTPAAARDEESQDKFVTQGFYVALGLGFVVGFWGVCGILIFSRSWRYAYYNFLNDVNDWIHVSVAVHKAKLLRMIKN